MAAQIVDTDAGQIFKKLVYTFYPPLRMARDIEIMQMIHIIPLVQNRLQNWELYFRRSAFYVCYRSGESTSEGLMPPYDADGLADFPFNGEAPAPCP